MTEAEIRAAHPDWSEGQVAAEVARLAALPPNPPNPPEPRKPERDPEVDRAMAEMRRRTEAAEAEARRLKDAEAERERKALEEQGRWEERAKAEKDRADALEATIAERDAKALVEKARSHAQQEAADLKFRDPGYALYKLDARGVDYSDAAGVKAALEALAQSQPDMLTVPPPPLPSGGPTAPAPNGGGPALTKAQLDAMTTAQMQALDPKVLNAALAAL
jgi:hypothetical protein